MGPPELPRRSESRYTTLSISRVLIKLPLVGAVLLLMVSVYLYLFWPAPPQQPSTAQGVGLMIILPAAFPVGGLLGDLVWCFLGKRFLGFTRDEVEPFVRTVMPIALLTRYKNWYMDLVFGPGSDASARPHGTTDVSGADRLPDDMNILNDVLYECAAARITEHWDEQTTKQFSMAMLKTDWWQARRGTLRVMRRALAFDEWTLPYTEIDDAVVTVVKGIVPSYIIRLKSHGNSYQFSVGGSYFGGALPFPARRTTVKGFTWSYLMARLLPLIALLALFLWSRRR